MKLYDIDEYRTTAVWPHAISAGCVVYRITDGNTEVLLLERGVGHSHNPHNQAIYSLPKGHVAFDETLVESATRETEEEAGVVIEIQTYLGATLRSYDHPAYDVKVEKATHYFAGLWQSDLDKMDHEHDAKLWVSPNDAIKLLNQVTPERAEAEIIQRLEKFLELTK